MESVADVRGMNGIEITSWSTVAHSLRHQSLICAGEDEEHVKIYNKSLKK